MTPCQKVGARQKSQFHCHMMPILSQNQTSIHEEHFPCSTVSYQRGFDDEKHVQRGEWYKKSRCPWDGVHLRTSITLRALPSDKQQLYESLFEKEEYSHSTSHGNRAVNRQPGFRRELVEQNHHRNTVIDNPQWGRMQLKTSN